MENPVKVSLKKYQRFCWVLIRLVQVFVKPNSYWLNQETSGKNRVENRVKNRVNGIRWVFNPNICEGRCKKGKSLKKNCNVLIVCNLCLLGTPQFQNVNNGSFGEKFDSYLAL